MVNHITVIAYGSDDSFVRRIQEDPTIGIAAFRSLQRLQRLMLLTQLTQYQSHFENALEETESMMRQLDVPDLLGK